MVNIVDDLLAKHSDTEIIEWLYREMQVVNKHYDTVIDGAQDAVLLLTQENRVKLVTDVLKALYKRNQERLARQVE